MAGAGAGACADKGWGAYSAGVLPFLTSECEALGDCVCARGGGTNDVCAGADAAAGCGA